MNTFHFLRPWFLITLIPLGGLFILGYLNHKYNKGVWSKACDAHLLPHLLVDLGKKEHQFSLFLLFGAMFFLIISLAGPTWSKKEVPVYKPVQPYVIVLDMSDKMFSTDISPNRLKRAKFKLHELFKHPEAGQFAMIVYTREPFIVSPLTDDAKTIDALLSSLTEDVMPIGGNKLDLALLEAEKLIQQAKFKEGNILVLTPNTPTEKSLNIAKNLKHNNIKSSIMPILIDADNANYEAFKHFAKNGGGELVHFKDNKNDIIEWLSLTQKQTEIHKKSMTLEIWNDKGRWFLIPALFLFLPIFRKGWLDKVSS